MALLMADTETAAVTLSARARADLVRRGFVEEGGVSLADGNRADAGDLVVSRLNERRLRTEAGEGFVANRDTWRVTERGRDGSLVVVSVTSMGLDVAAREVQLPASYVTAKCSWPSPEPFIRPKAEPTPRPAWSLNPPRPKRST